MLIFLHPLTLSIKQLHFGQFFNLFSFFNCYNDLSYLHGLEGCHY